MGGKLDTTACVSSSRAGIDAGDETVLLLVVTIDNAAASSLSSFSDKAEEFHRKKTGCKD